MVRERLQARTDCAVALSKYVPVTQIGWLELRVLAHIGGAGGTGGSGGGGEGAGRDPPMKHPCTEPMLGSQKDGILEVALLRQYNELVVNMQFRSVVPLLAFAGTTQG